ncbi:nSTAND3 domain-containing NTPase [Pseudomonas laurentiana]
MNDYDFYRLNDKEFEILCTDLIGASEGVRFERFKPGRDAGVDGRYFSPHGGEWILQAKHWAATPLSQLISHLRTSESRKVTALKPERYILVVSHALSRLNKKELISALPAYCPVEVYGKEDLNQLLAQFPDIERRHFKLWISSSTVLFGLFNNAINGRSDAMMMDIVEKSKVFAHTRNFEDAADKLQQLGTVIITGEAGIGKTTLAQQLILYYFSHGFRLTSISQDIREAEQAYDPEQPQLFYFDDFLGRNYLQALSGHEGSQIVNFIKRVKRDKSKKKFILTSRSTILNQGHILNDIFEHNNISKNEMEIRLSSLSSLDKAHILYNHIWHSGLNPLYIDEIYSESRYRKIIAHKNFNPRIIQFITDPQRVEDIPAAKYWPHIRNLLDNPAKVWEHPFDAQLDDYGRFLVLLVAFNGESLGEADLIQAYAAGLAMHNNANFTGRRDFQVAVRHLSNSLLTRFFMFEEPYYKLFNPSLGDFLLHRYANDLATLTMTFKCLRSQTAASVIFDMARNKFIDSNFTLNILRALWTHEKELNFKGCDPEYLARICIGIAAIDHTSNHCELIDATSRMIVSCAIGNEYFYRLQVLHEALNQNILEATDVEAFLVEAVQVGASDDEMPHLAELVAELEDKGCYSASEGLADICVESMVSSMSDYFEESNVFRYGYDLQAARRRLEDLISDKYNTWRINPTDDMIQAVIDAYELKDRMDEYFASESTEYHSSTRATPIFDIVGIDDLFQRDK